jgi:hypothetical protein
VSAVPHKTIAPFGSSVDSARVHPGLPSTHAERGRSRWASAFEEDAPAVPVSPVEHSFTVLDRWLLPVIKDHGGITAADFSEQEEALTAGSKHGAQLTAEQAISWLDSARRRGLLERYPIDLAGDPVSPPLWGLSELGRARLAEAVSSTRFVPARLGKTLMPILENAGKTLLALASVYLAARATKVLHSGTAVSPTAAQIAIGVLIAAGLAIYLVIRNTDNRQARDQAIGVITTSDPRRKP